MGLLSRKFKVKKAIFWKLAKVLLTENSDNTYAEVFLNAPAAIKSAEYYMHMHEKIFQG